MNSFDSSILLTINSFAGHSRMFDAVMHGFTNNYLFKAAPLSAILFAFWFKNEPDAAAVIENRSRILSAFAAATVAPLVARIMNVWLPFRPRPFQESELHFTLPAFMNLDDAKMIGWSSFPSDNVALLFGLVAGIFALSRCWGWPALALALVAGFARVYSGIHHPTDIIVGALLGVACYLVIDRTPVRLLITRPSFFILEKNAPLFYAGLFLLIDQIAHLFWESVSLVQYVVYGVKIY